MRRIYIRQPSNFSEFDFISVNDEEKIIKFKQGSWKILHDIHIPANHSVIINDSTNLDLQNSSSIFSSSPIFMLGSIENPISITSSDSTGQGIFVLNAKETSVMDYVYFKNLSNLSKKFYNLTGAITFL